MRDVVVVGGGPVGLFLAALLAQRGLDVSVWEKRTTPARSSRAIGIHPPALEVLAGLGLAEPVVEKAVLIREGSARSSGRILGTVSFAGVSDAFPFVASLPQFETEALLEARLEDLVAGAVRRGIELQALDDVDPSQVRLHGRSLDGPVFEVARFVIGADGARSAVRNLLGVKASLRAYADPYVMGDFRDDTGDGDVAAIYLEQGGVVESFPLPGGRRRFVAHSGVPLVRPTADQVATIVTDRTGLDVDPTTGSTLSAFVTRRRFAEHLVRGRVVLVGDAAHEISPIGGQGMNLGWLDAHELAPLLARSIETGRLDVEAYEAFEVRRLQVARRAARQAEANMALGRPSGPIRRRARDAGFSVVLATPASRLLAQAYSMSWH